MNESGWIEFEEMMADHNLVYLEFSVPKDQWDYLADYFLKDLAHKEGEGALPFIWYLLDCVKGDGNPTDSALMRILMDRYCAMCHGFDEA